MLPKCLITSVQRHNDTLKGQEDNFAVSLVFFFCFCFGGGGEEEEMKGRK